MNTFNTAYEARNEELVTGQAGGVNVINETSDDLMTAIGSQASGKHEELVTGQAGPMETVEVSAEIPIARESFTDAVEGQTKADEGVLSQALDNMNAEVRP